MSDLKHQVADLTIRVANKADLPAINNLYSQPEMNDGESLSLEQTKNLFNKITNYPDYKIYVAETVGGIIVGSFGLLIMDRLDHCGDPSGVLSGVVVDPNFHRQKIGEKMMQYAMQQCSSAGCYKLILSSNFKRENAHRFYEALGFKQHGISFALDLL